MSKNTRPKRAKKQKTTAPAGSDMSTGEATVESLIAHGLDTVYALPGVHNDHLFDAFSARATGSSVVHARHEQGAAYMALGAALATGKPQAYAVVPGPGLLNSGAALLTAYGMNAPVLGADRPNPGCAPSAAAKATCTKSATRPASSPGWSTITPISAARPRRRQRVAKAIARDAPTAGRARRRWNAPSMSGASAARSRPIAPPAGARRPPHRRGRAAAPRKASRQSQARPDRLPAAARRMPRSR